MSLQALSVLTQPISPLGQPPKGIDWITYFKSIGRGVKDIGEINVSTVEALKKGSLLSSSPTLPHYLCFHVVNKCAPHLSNAFVNTHFEFHEKVLSGTTEIRYINIYTYICIFTYTCMYIYIYK
jgi:predicted metalloendopeptidase